MEKALGIQKQIRDNAKTLNSYMTDLQNWEAEMKRKEAALSGEFEQVIPPVRSKSKKEKPVLVKKKPEPRILASDYRSWEKFDVDKACEDIDMEAIGPASLDGKKSQSAKMEKLRDEAQHEKERGNNFVKLEKWDEAISCYNRAIELVKDDAIYYANRGLCYLKKESLHQAETDCTAALRLDPTYVKALQRRATAREALGSLRAASSDLVEVLRLQPRNSTARAQLEGIRARMGTKGANSKSSPSSTPTSEAKLFLPSAVPPSSAASPPGGGTAQLEAGVNDADRWRRGEGEDVTVLRPVKKPPHLRSRRPLKSVLIQEIPLGKSSPERPPTRLKIMELDSDSNKENNDGDSDAPRARPESVKLAADEISSEKEGLVAPVVSAVSPVVPPPVVPPPVAPPPVVPPPVVPPPVVPLVPPTTNVQFMAQWNRLKGNDEALSDYFYSIEPSKIPSIFSHSLESGVVSELLRALHVHPRRRAVLPRLRALTRVRRFRALALFLHHRDKLLLTDLLEYCKNEENCDAEELADLKSKFEL